MFLLLTFCVGYVHGNEVPRPKKFDIVVYGGTSAGIASAIQASRSGKTVLLIEPTQRIGGLTTGGLGATDIGNKNAIGGISREFYENIYKLKGWPWPGMSKNRFSVVAHYTNDLVYERVAPGLLAELNFPTAGTYMFGVYRLDIQPNAVGRQGSFEIETL